MSDFRGHVAAGAAFYGLFAFTAVVLVPAIAGRDVIALVREWWEIPVQLVVAILAALWPDVDITSKGRNVFYRIFLALDLFLMATGRWREAAFLGFVAILPGLGRHRGWTHTLWAAFVVPSPIIVAPLFWSSGGEFASEPDLTNFGMGLPYYLAAIAGYLSHLAADDMLGGALGGIMRILLWPVRAFGTGQDKDHDRF